MPMNPPPEVAACQASDKPDRPVRIVLFGVQGEVIKQTGIMPASLAREVIELFLACEDGYGSGIEARDADGSLTDWASGMTLLRRS